MPELLMPPFHEFILLDSNDVPYRKHPQPGQELARAQLDDDFIHFILDSLTWVETINPAGHKLKRTRGLNLYGPSVLDIKSADLFENILKSWAGLFRLGPAEISLRVGWQLTKGEAGKPLIESFHRDSLVAALDTISSMCEKVKSNKGLYILHLGI